MVHYFFGFHMALHSPGPLYKVPMLINSKPYLVDLHPSMFIDAMRAKQHTVIEEHRIQKRFPGPIAH